MNTGQTIFSQIMSFIPKYEFDKRVIKYKGNYRIRQFSCWDQFLCMSFAQLTYRESLRDIEVCLNAQPNKLYHMGIKGNVTRTNIAHANWKRDWRIYAEFAQVLISHARKLYHDDPEFIVDLDSTVYALDATTIDLCLSLFPWAKFRKNKGAVKLHTLLDIHGSIPVFIEITTGLVHDVNILDVLIPEPGSFYIMDRAYLDYQRLYRIKENLGYFIIHAKKNMKFYRTQSKKVDKSTGLRCDQVIRLSVYKSLKCYPDKLRRVKYHDRETDKILVFLTNNFDIPALTVAELYRNRWRVGVSKEGRMIQPVEVRSRLKDSRPCSLGGAVAREQDGEALRQHSLKGGCAMLQVVTCSERRCSLVTRKIRWPSLSICVRRQQEVAI